MKKNSAIEHFLKMHPELALRRRGLPGTGRRCDNREFFEDVQVIDDTFRFSNSLYELEDKIDKRLTLYNAGAGSPLRMRPYLPTVELLCKESENEDWSQYQIAAGNIESRKYIAKKLNKYGFQNINKEAINEDNLIFTNSTTEAFYFLIKLLTRPYDVVLFAGPTYGLFTYIPERLGAISRIMPLKEQDNWIVNIDRLSKTIDDINIDLTDFAKKNDLEYIPRVIAYVNINPSNPTGKVMGIKHKKELLDMAHVCSQKGVFIVDDIIYSGLCYNPEETAIPIATLDNNSGNIITLIGASKTYSLAAARVGMVVANEVIIRGLRDFIFQQMDSTPLYAGKIMQSIFDDSNFYREKYLTDIRETYIHKWKIVYALINGLSSVSVEDQLWITELVKKCCKTDFEEVLQPVRGIKLAGNIIPESGFFVMLDFTDSKGMKYNEVTIRTEKDVLYFYYVYAYVKLLMGQSIGWPNKNEFVARVSFALPDNDIVNMIKQMKNAARKLKG